jgi:large subunit ribosomal protein L21
MYAVIQTGGKQYRVSPGELLKIEKLPDEVGETVAFDRVLLASDGEKVDVGTPFLENTKVTGQIMRHGKNRKVLVMKYKKRKKYRRNRGHRQQFTEVRIDTIQ